jgi:hypothetical protein
MRWFFWRRWRHARRRPGHDALECRAAGVSGAIRHDHHREPGTQRQYWQCVAGRGWITRHGCGEHPIPGLGQLWKHHPRRRYRCGRYLLCDSDRQRRNQQHQRQHDGYGWRHDAGQQLGDRASARSDVHVVPARRVGLPVLHQPSRGRNSTEQSAAGTRTLAAHLAGHSPADLHYLGLQHRRCHRSTCGRRR